MKVVRVADQSVLVAQCAQANTFFPRLKGWIGKRSVREDEGLWFPRCNSVHMWWMSIPIDVVFLTPTAGADEGRFRVTSVHPRTQPWKLLPLLDRKASDALELGSGAVERLRIQVGEEVLCIS